MMRINWRLEVPQLLLLATMFIAAMAAWQSVPSQIPVNRNFAGEVDRMGGKFEGLFALPLTATGLYVLLLVLPKFDPARANYPSFETAYAVIRVSTLVALAVVDGCLLLSALGHHVRVGLIIPIILCAMFVTFGNVMGKLRPNWFVGVRTPWTLSSRRSWNKTHRLAGWLFIAMGVAIGAVGVVPSPWTIALAIAVNIISVLWMVIYSYVVWRGDPDRLSATSISPESAD